MGTIQGNVPQTQEVQTGTTQIGAFQAGAGGLGVVPTGLELMHTVAGTGILPETRVEPMNAYGMHALAQPATLLTTELLSQMGINQQQDEWKASVTQPLV